MASLIELTDEQQKQLRSLVHGCPALEGECIGKPDRAPSQLLVGVHEAILDDKYRINIPVALRKAFGKDGGYIVHHTYDRCLWLFPEREYSFIYDQIVGRTTPIDQDTLLLKTYFTFQAASVQFEDQGRFVVPAAMREVFSKASGKQPVVLKGSGNFLEISPAVSESVSNSGQ